jgi:isopentenyldiphosphate isomerase
MLLKKVVNHQEIIHFICALQSIVNHLENHHVEDFRARNSMKSDDVLVTEGQYLEDIRDSKRTLKQLLSAEDSVNEYFEFFKEVTQLLGDVLRDDFIFATDHVDELYQQTLKTVQQLIILHCGHFITINLRGREYQLMGLLDHINAQAIYLALKKTVIDKINDDQVAQSAIDYIGALNNHVHNNNFKFSGEILENIFRYLPLSDQAWIPTVCRHWQKFSSNARFWRLKLREDIGVEADQFALLKFPDKVYRRLQELQKRRYFTRNDSNRGHEYPVCSRNGHDFEEILYYIKEKTLDVTVYPEIFYPFVDVAQVNFQRMLDSAPLYKLKFWLELACLRGNYELIRHLTILDRSLLSSHLLPFAAVSGDMTLTQFISPRGDTPRNVCQLYFDHAMKLGNHKAGSYFRKIWGGKILNDDPCRISIQFVGAVINGSPSLIAWLRNVIYPNFDINQMLSDQFMPLNDTQDHRNNEYPCHLQILRASCPEASLMNIRTFIESFNIDISVYSRPYFKMITNDLITNGAIIDIDKVIYLCSKRGYAENALSECLFWDDVVERLVALYKIKNRDYLGGQGCDLRKSQYIYGILIVMSGSLEMLKNYINSFEVNVNFISTCCVQAVLRGHSEILAYLLKHNLVEREGFMDAILGSAATYGSLSLFQLYFEHYPQNQDHLLYLDDVMSSENLRLAEYLFDELNIAIPEDWGQKNLMMCSYMTDYIRQRYAEQQAERNLAAFIA